MTFDGCQSQCQFNQFEIKSAKLIIVTVNMNSINSTQTIWQEKEEKTTRSMPNQIYLSLQNSKWTHGKCVWWKMWDAMRFGWNEFIDFSIYFTSSSGKCQKFGDLIERRDQFSIVVDVSYEFNFRYFERWRKKRRERTAASTFNEYWIEHIQCQLCQLCHRIHPFTYWYALVYTQFHVNQTKAGEKRDEAHGKKSTMENGIGNLLWISRINFFFFASLLFDILFVSVVFFFFCISLNRAEAFPFNI